MKMFNILFLSNLPPTVIGGPLSVLGKRCGTKICEILQFCSSFNSQCDDCQNVCDESSHNFDHEICISQCQDYLHEIRYAKSNSNTVDIKNLQHQQTFILIISLILLILFILVHGIHMFRWLSKKDYLSFIKKIKKGKIAAKNSRVNSDMTHENPHTHSPQVIKRNANNRAIHRPTSTIYSITGNEGSTIQTVSTPISNRYPAESSLECSYDNPGLQITPTHDKPKTETTF